jgi:K+-sensing histidine kinase KdpD
MKMESLVRSHRPVLVAAAAIVPLVACAVLAAFRASVTSTTAVLVLVLVVVAAAATGVRPAGIVAALSSSAWFDFFLTEPHGRFAITDRDDIEAAVLLLLVGVAVTEIALWGRRQQARASRRAGYLDGVLRTAEIVAVGQTSPERLIDHVSSQIVEILDIDACRFAPNGIPGRPSASLDHDGSVTQHGHPVSVERHGLPTDDEIALDVRHGGASHGQFLLTSATRIARPSIEQRGVVVLLADEVGAALANRPA